jgi:acetamidase/formamidase
MLHRSLCLGLATAVAVTSATLAVTAAAQDHTVLATPQTVAWGYYSGSAKPVLTVKSGETVKMQTLASCGDDKALIRDGVKPADVPAYIAPIHAQVTDKGPGGHILTGPIAVEGAEIGDVLEVEVVKIDIDTPFACNHFRPGAGFIPNEFPYSGGKIIPLDRTKMVANFAPGIVIPLHPFFGSMGVAPGAMRINSAPPWMHGGNMDNKELTEGSRIFYPVLSKGGLFEAGDGHAGQGNGEVDITALETFLSGTFRFTVHKDQHLLWPRAETATHYISMGFSPDLKEAATIALRNMIDFLVTEKHMTRSDAYMLTSVACDMDITQVVDTNDGVHVMCPKNIFVGK